MKKIAMLLIVVGLIFTSCRRFENTVNNLHYQNPRTIGGLWTVKQGNIEINHCKCIYWSTNDDDALFEDSNGKKFFVNGSSMIFQE